MHNFAQAGRVEENFYCDKITEDVVNIRKMQFHYIFSRIIFKDAGFVYESLRNETNRVIWKKNFHETNLSKTNPRNESTIRILKVGIRES